MTETDETPREWPTLDEWDHDKASLGVIANGVRMPIGKGTGYGAVLWYVGGAFASCIEEACFRGLDEMGLDDAPPGLSVFQGRLLGDGEDSELVGTFRPLTPGEARAVTENRCPWNFREWLRGWKPVDLTTRPDLDGIEARAKAATPGPWEFLPHTAETGGRTHIVFSQGHERVPEAEVCWPEDAIFIAQARADIPALLAYVRELEARLGSARTDAATTEDKMTTQREANETATTLELPEAAQEWFVEACARMAHEMNRVYCREALGDASQPAWEDAPDWQKTSARKGVALALRGATPEQSHESWTQEKVATGWKYGPVKDPEKKEHPCLVPYAELPPEQRFKDALFLATVRQARALVIDLHHWMMIEAG